jgi:choline-glycine betaine transporter
MVRAYSWLTFMWGVVFLVRVAVQWVLYRADEVELLGTASLLLGLPVTAVEVVVTLWAVSRLHRHRMKDPPAPHRSHARGGTLQEGRQSPETGLG